MQARIEMIKTGFGTRYSMRKNFLDEPYTEELIKLLLQKDNIEKILRLCLAGQAPLRAVVYEVEKFAEEHGIVKGGAIPDEWKQDVGMLIGTIVYFLGYVSDGDKPKDKEDLQRTPKYFHYAVTFHKK